MQAKIEIKRDNIFYRINDIQYQKYDDNKSLNVLLNDTDQNASGAKITITKPDGTSINKSVVLSQINQFLLNFLSTDCDKSGKYEFSMIATKPTGETQFQKFLYTVSDYTDQILFKVEEDSSAVFDAVRRYIDERLDNLNLEKY